MEEVDMYMIIYFHYVTSLIRSWIYVFKVTIKAFGSCEFPVWKKQLYIPV